MTKRIALLGSTGSIGRQTLDVVASMAGSIEVVALGGGQNLPLLIDQAARFRPRYLASPALSPDHSAFRAVGCSLISAEEIAVLPEADLIIVATVGKVGLAPTLAAVRAGKTAAVANREVLVIAGGLLRRLGSASGAAILPIDSEHCAIWQCLRGEQHGVSADCGVINTPAMPCEQHGGRAVVAEARAAPNEAWPTVSRLVLTASGGPFRDFDPAALAAVTPRQALHHPTWHMGPKITVDSATLMNKGLEVIEAHWLFDVDYDRIDVVLHRESVVHSFVEFVDGALKAQLGPPDMRLPIQYALTYPARVAARWPRLDLHNLHHLTFGTVDEDRFPCLRLARQAGELGGTAPAVLSAADEVAVDAFLAGALDFVDIPGVIATVLDEHECDPDPDLSALLAADQWARQASRKFVEKQGTAVRWR